jgi:hypothetical protein
MFRDFIQIFHVYASNSGQESKEINIYERETTSRDMDERSMHAAAARKTASQHHFTTTRVLALHGHNSSPTF